ncbi:MAG: SagB/ThcOx family dehydrogenase, partial [Microcystaceae cyanobacterium]
PSSFKEYKIGTIYDLKPYLSNPIAPGSDDEEWARLSRFLACSYGLTATVAIQGQSLYLRAAPSAGGLYPAELYLVSKGGGGNLLPSGLYSYQPQTHSLVHFWQDEVWSKLTQACFNQRIFNQVQWAIVTTAIFSRSVWRYEDRAYRRILLDTGHLLGNIELSGSINGFRPYLMGGFNDRAIADLFYLDSEQESAIAVMGLQDEEKFPQPSEKTVTALPSAIHRDYPKLREGDLLAALHRATLINEPPDNFPSPAPLGDKYNFPFCLKIPTQTAPIDWHIQLTGLEKTILRRRSTRAYSGADLTLAELRAVLDFTYQPEHYFSQNLDSDPDYFDLGLIQTFIAVSGVSGLEEGCYYYAPLAQELRQIRFKHFRPELGYLCLGQELGRDAAAVVFHTADLTEAVERYGDRAYRYLHLDAGHLGQRLNLAAIHLGLGVSGIAGFFDDQVNEVLGIPTDEAVLYITTLGRPRYPQWP